MDQPFAYHDDAGGTGFHFLHHDGHGSVVAVTNSAGNVEARFTYGPFGETSNPTGSPYHYAARQIDAETGLYYNRARYYSTKLGRFLSPDPIGYADGLNIYAYVGNDPVNATDPTGLIGTTDDTNQQFDGDDTPENIVITRPRPTPRPNPVGLALRIAFGGLTTAGSGGAQAGGSGGDGEQGDEEQCPVADPDSFGRVDQLLNDAGKQAGDEIRSRNGLREINAPTDTSAKTFGGNVGSFAGGFGQRDETFGALITANRQFLIFGRIVGFEVGLVNRMAGARSHFGPKPFGTTAIALGQPRTHDDSNLDVSGLAADVAIRLDISTIFVQLNSGELIRIDSSGDPLHPPFGATCKTID